MTYAAQELRGIETSAANLVRAKRVLEFMDWLDSNDIGDVRGMFARMVEDGDISEVWGYMTDWEKDAIYVHLLKK